MPFCYIMMGPSGSGKTRWLTKNLLGAVVVSANSYFIQKDGSFVFDRDKLSQAHAHCLREFVRLAQEGHEVLAVDNTNTLITEIAPYFALAQAYGYDPHPYVVGLTKLGDIRGGFHRMTQKWSNRSAHGASLAAVRAQTTNLIATLEHWPRYWASPRETE